jgi:hypothetical protein
MCRASSTNTEDDSYSERIVSPPDVRGLDDIGVRDIVVTGWARRGGPSRLASEFRLRRSPRCGVEPETAPTEAAGGRGRGKFLRDLGDLKKDPASVDPLPGGSS